MYRTGHIKKAHGIKGEVIYVTESGHEIHPNELLYLQMHSGDLRPFRTQEVRPASALSDSSFFVLFSGTNSRTDAEALKGLPVFSEKEPEALPQEAEEITVFDCVTFSIEDETGSVKGTITEVAENPAHPLLIADTGTHTLMIPAVEAYIADIDFVGKHITGRNLELLLEIASENDNR